MGWLSRVWLFVGTTKNVEIYLLLTTARWTRGGLGLQSAHSADILNETYMCIGNLLQHAFPFHCFIIYNCICPVIQTFNMIMLLLFQYIDGV